MLRVECIFGDGEVTELILTALHMTALSLKLTVTNFPFGSLFLLLVASFFPGCWMNEETCLWQCLHRDDKGCGSILSLFYSKF